MIKRVCVFCGSYTGENGNYQLAANILGKTIAERGLELVYGGSRVGLMGAVAKGALSAGGHVIGIIPEALVEKELAHDEISEMHVVGSMHQRKAMMAELADAFITMPGGFGTMDETFEALTWAQLGFHQKAITLLNIDGYYDRLLHFFEFMLQEDFIRRKSHGLIVVKDDPVELVDFILTYRPPHVEKWLKKGDV